MLHPSRAYIPLQVNSLLRANRTTQTVIAHCVTEFVHKLKASVAHCCMHVVLFNHVVAQSLMQFVVLQAMFVQQVIQRSVVA